MARTLTDFGRDVAKITDPAAIRRMVREGGMAAKKAALGAATDSLGGDRAFSGMRRKAPLGAGFDDLGGTSVQLNLRPAGLWRLAESGRQSSGKIVPRRGSGRGGRRALRTPLGPRASSSYGPSRGLRTFTHAAQDARRTVPKAVEDQFRNEVAKAMR